MSYEHALVALGLLAALAPFVGLPYSWLMVLLPVLGILVIVLALIMRTRRKQATLSVAPAEPLHEETRGSF